MVTKKDAGRVADDPLVGSTWIAEQLDSSDRYARLLMAGGEFGPRYDIGKGDVRARWRVRQSAVVAWIAARKAGAAATELTDGAATKQVTDAVTGRLNARIAANRRIRK